jgi:hypothetical protein
MYLSNLNLLLINWLKKILRSSTVYINKSPWNISTVAGTVFFDVTRNTAHWHPSWFWMSLGKKKKLASRSYYILFDLAIIDYGSFCDTIPQNKCCHLHHYVVWLQLIFIFCRILISFYHTASATSHATPLSPPNEMLLFEVSILWLGALTRWDFVHHSSSFKQVLFQNFLLDHNRNLHNSLKKARTSKQVLDHHTFVHKGDF